MLKGIFHAFLCDNLRAAKIIFEYNLRHLMARVPYLFREICCTNELVIYNFVHCNVFNYFTIKVHSVELKSVWVEKETFKTESKLIKTQFQKNSFSQLLSIFHALFQSFLYKIHNWFASSVEPVEYMWHRKKISFSFEIGEVK